MPELPEVLTITKDLNEHLKGSTITNIKITDKYKVFPNNAAFVNTVKGKKIKEVTHIAKNIVFELKDQFIVFHLAMTGRLLLRDRVNKTDKWIKIVFYIDNGRKESVLTFTDMRTFGKVKLYSEEGIKELKKRYGPEPIDDSAEFDVFFENVRSKRSNIKNVLLDQSKVSGLGNIYVTDTLFLAKVHPKTHTSDIDRSTAKILWDSAKKILNEGILHRGSTLPDRMYVDIFGKEGSHQDHFRVYLRDNCPDCDTKIEYIKLNSRGTYFCPSCQVLP
jgi:formamidopyrimidine-DNA glycosylase